MGVRSPVHPVPTPLKMYDDQGRIQDWSEGGGGVPKVANVK